MGDGAGLPHYNEGPAYYLPLNLLLHYMVKNKWSNIQLYSKVNSVQSYEKRLIMVNVHEECYLIVFLHRLISVMCLKCPPSAQCLFLNRARHWTTNALIVLFTDCLCEVEAWMRASRLRLNPQKTQLIS